MRSKTSGPRGICLLVVGTLLCATAPARGAITATTKVHLERVDPAAPQSAQRLDPAAFPREYGRVKTGQYDFYGSTNNTVADTYVWTDVIEQLANTARFLSSIYDCASAIVANDPLGAFSSCRKLPQSFVDYVNKTIKTVDALDEANLFTIYPSYYYNRVVIEFSAHSDSISDLQGVAISYPQGVRGITGTQTSYDRKTKGARVVLDLVEMRKGMFDNRNFFNQVPLGFVVRENAILTTLSTGHSVHVKVDPGLTGVADFAADVDTSYALSSGTAVVRSGRVPSSDPNVRPTLLYQYPGLTSNDVETGILRLQYAPNGYFYDQGRRIDSVKVDFHAAAPFTPLYGTASRMRVQWNGATGAGSALPAVTTPTVQQVVPAVTTMSGVTLRYEGDGHVVHRFDPRILGARPSTTTLVYVAQAPGYFFSQHMVNVVVEPAPAIAAPTRVTVQPGNGQAAVSWGCVPNATSYRVDYGYTASFANPAYRRSVTATQCSTTLTGLFNGASHSLTVRAITPYGQGPASAVAVFTPSGPLTGLQVIALPATADTYAVQAQPTTPRDARDPAFPGTLHVSNVAAQEKRAFMRFDLSRIPAGVAITKAELRLASGVTATQSSSSLSVRAIAAGTSFSESALTWNNQPGVARYLGAATFRYVGSALSLPPIPLDAQVLKSYLGTGLGAWQGLRITGSPAYVRARETAIASERPQLVVTYYYPPPGSTAPGTGGNKVARPRPGVDRMLTGDLDGDGALDGCGRHAGGVTCWIQSAAGERVVPGPAFADSLGWSEPRYAETLALADMNGDGKADLCARRADGIACWPFDGERFGLEFVGPALTDGAGWAEAAYYRTIRYADVDGDGRADVCARRADGVRCWLSDGQGFPVELAGPDLSDARGWSSASESLMWSDVDGDARADLCARTSDGYRCWISDDAGFQTEVAGPVVSGALLPDDADGDGRAALCDGAGPDRVCYLSTGRGFSAASLTAASTAR